MLVYEGIKQGFINDVLTDNITRKIHEKYQKFFGRSGEAQIKSWKNSMEYMYKVLNDNEIPDDSGVAIEFNIPSTSKRVDFMLSGYDKNNKDSVIIIELKQWDTCARVEGRDGLVKTFVGGGFREVTHPSYQAWSYASLIMDFNESVQKELINLYPCAYLHNYKITPTDALVDEMYKEYIDDAPLFGMGDVLKLREFIKKYITYGDNKELLYKIENGKIRPSRRLQDSLKNMLNGNKEFVMIDEQKVVYETALDLANKSYNDKKKRVLVVNGGPGTGKSVLAINLLVELTNKNMVTNYITKNAAPRNVFYDRLKGNFKASYIKNLFKGSGMYVDSEKNIFDALIVDEAHRLNAKSGMFKNKGENQIKEIIHASKFSVFFLDENQKVTLSDIGSLDVIEKYAKQLDAEIQVVELESQFRCNGSDGYLNWLDNVLDIRETANYNFDFDYDFKVLDDPNELKELISEKNDVNNKSRMVAGYCWNWISNAKNNSEIHDVVIPEHNFGMSWNLANSSTWAIDSDSIKEIGCIHTCQGLEFDYVGVIIGEDIRYENGQIVTDFTKRAGTDKSLFGIKAMYNRNPEEALKVSDKIIKNTYKTLMTRGMKGCYVYCVDKNLQNYLKEKLNNL
ncbi:MAG: DUF2075 domain-containing protein [Bacilli bacterium]|nr:DUF2075 domain-containing protein [Bacilli bacterium]MDD4719181.1 DUF2075 domain-containing protein [Bacilli bacterium]